MLNKRIELNKEVIENTEDMFSDMEDGGVLTTKDNRVVFLNEMAVFILKQLGACNTILDIAEKVKNTTMEDLPSEDELLQDVLQFVCCLQSEGIVLVYDV